MGGYEAGTWQSVAFLNISDLGSQVLLCPRDEQMPTGSLWQFWAPWRPLWLSQEGSQGEKLSPRARDSRGLPRLCAWTYYLKATRAPYLSSYPMCPVTPPYKCPQRPVPRLDASPYSNSIYRSPLGDASGPPKASELILPLFTAPCSLQCGT